MMKTPTEWEKFTGITIMDPDGWRRDNKPWDDPISQREWEMRMMDSTIMCDPKVFKRRVAEESQ